MRLRWIVLLAGAAGCGMLSGLDGLTVQGDASVDAGVESAADDASLDVGPSCEAGTCGAPSGFQPLLFATGATTSSCPTNTTSLDVVVDPTAPANACSCTCDFQPVCVPQTFTYNSGNGCSSKVATTVVLDGGCDNANNQPAPAQMSVGPFAPTNACNSSTKVNGTVSETQGRVCGIADCSACSAPPGFALCFGQAGDVPCPPNTKTMTKHTIGASAQLGCSACTACSSTAKCKGTLSVFNDFSCNTAGNSVGVDGTCQALTVFALGSVQYTPSVDPGVCTPGTSTPSVSISAQTTVCCP